jgi:FkbM family methyltransferase
MKKTIKRIYSLIPFKKEAFTVIKKVFNPGHKVYQHLYFKGIIKVDVGDGKSFKMRHYGNSLENDLFWKGINGRWEKTSMGAWMKLSENSKVILDIGANTGVFSLVSKSLNPYAKVIAFEPVKRVFEKLKTNMALNNYNVICYPFAVSDHEGETTFYDTYSEHTYTVVLNKDLSHDARYHEVRVPITTVDKIVEEQGLDRIDLIKLDVETHEPEVLQGFSFIKKFEPTILIEILSDEIGKKVEEILKRNDCSYLYFDIDEEYGFKRVKHISKSSGFNYLLCTEEAAKELEIL